MVSLDHIAGALKERDTVNHTITVTMKGGVTRTFDDADGADYRFRLAARVGFAVITDRFGTEVWIPSADIHDIVITKEARI